MQRFFLVAAILGAVVLALVAERGAAADAPPTVTDLAALKAFITGKKDGKVIYRPVGAHEQLEVELHGDTVIFRKGTEEQRGTVEEAVAEIDQEIIQGALRRCQSNLKNVGTALEMYSTDNGGHFPAQLSQLTPNYLVRIPTCPAAGRDTYSESYRSSANPDAYSFFCAGHNHGAADIPADFPRYDSTQGLIPR